VYLTVICDLRPVQLGLSALRVVRSSVFDRTGPSVFLVQGPFDNFTQNRTRERPLFYPVFISTSCHLSSSMTQHLIEFYSPKAVFSGTECTKIVCAPDPAWELLCSPSPRCPGRLRRTIPPPHSAFPSTLSASRRPVRVSLKHFEYLNLSSLFIEQQVTNEHANHDLNASSGIANTKWQKR